MRKIHARAGTITRRRERSERGEQCQNPPLRRSHRQPGYREAARSQVSRSLAYACGGTEHVGITWAAHDSFRIGDCDCGCVPAIYRPRHAASRWRAGLAAARGATLRLRRNLMSALPNAWPGFAREPSGRLADHSRLRPSDWPGPTVGGRLKAEIHHPACPAPSCRQRVDSGQASSGGELRALCETARAAAGAAVERSWPAQQQAQETLHQVVRTRAATNNGLPRSAALTAHCGGPSLPRRSRCAVTATRGSGLRRKARAVTPPRR
jgi:hypothetical protein